MEPVKKQLQNATQNNVSNLPIKCCIHRWVAKNAERLFFAFAYERPRRSGMIDRIIKTFSRPAANANPQALRAVIY